VRWLWAPPQYLTDQDWRIVPIGEHRVLVLVGRVHAYRGHDLRHVLHPVRAAGVAGSPLLGAQFVDLTDAYAPRLRQLAPPEPTRSFAGM
jgi:purine nucleoside phosphorylase